MTGKKGGMGVLLRKLFGPKLITHHCLNHRIELVFGHAMDQYDSFHEIESMVNKIYSFYKRSGKTFGSMNDFLDNEELRHFSLNYIHKIRQRLLNRWTSQLDLECTTGGLERVVSVHNST